ncbi:MAG: ABC transporter ATP-binding protein [Tenericutes bacterium]|nr:ABC transporter ATP-binding protein [Mycoplasmatota bacterium]
MKKYGVFQNARYVYSQAEKFNKRYKYKLLTTFILGLVIPVMATFIPASIVYLIINGYAVKEFVLIVGLIVIVYAIISYINTYIAFSVGLENTFIRTKSFYEIICEKGRSTGYENMEFENGRNKLMKGMGAIQNNWVGVELLLKVFPLLITSFVGLLLYSTYVLTINFAIVLVLIGMTLMNLLLNAYARNYEKRAEDKQNTYRTKLRYFQEEANKLVNAKDIRIYKLENWFYKGIKFFTKKFSQTVMKQKSRYSLANFSDSLFSIARDLIAYTILVTMVTDGAINAVQFTFMIGIVLGFSVWLNQLSENIGRLKEANISINNYRDYILLDDLTNIEIGEDVSSLLEKQLTIEFRNVSFTYPKATKATISNFNLKINAGEKIALVGINGAGKTTLVKLLSGLYRPTQGEVLINGIPSNKFNTVDYYKLFGVIFQDLNTFPFTIAQNISGKSDVDTDFKLVDKVLEQSGLAEKVSILPNKEHTYLTQMIDESGIMLSGGQIQKLVLARALYKNAPILVLDEPTSALDPLAEQELYLQYDSLTKNKTSIFISHRLSSTQFCNRIIYLEDGAIQEMGNHKELMENSGKYAKMFEIQSQYYKENKKEENNCDF